MQLLFPEGFRAGVGSGDFVVNGPVSAQIDASLTRLELGGHCKVVSATNRSWLEAEQVCGPCQYHVRIPLGQEYCLAKLGMVVESSGGLEPQDYVVATWAINSFRPTVWKELRDDFENGLKSSEIFDLPESDGNERSMSVQVHLMAGGFRKNEGKENIRFTNLTLQAAPCGKTDLGEGIAVPVLLGTSFLAILLVHVAWRFSNSWTRSIKSDSLTTDKPSVRNFAQIVSPTSVSSSDDQTATSDGVTTDKMGHHEPESSPSPFTVSETSTGLLKSDVEKSHLTVSRGQKMLRVQLQRRTNFRRGSYSTNDLFKAEESLLSDESSRTAKRMANRTADSAFLDQWWYMDPQNIKFLKKVGAGHFGEAWRAEWKHVDVVVKIIKVKKWTPELIADFKNEVRLLARLSNHPRIVRFCGAVTVLPDLMMATQFMPFGSVYDRIVSAKFPSTGKRMLRVKSPTGNEDVVIPISTIIQILHDGAAALYHLHSHAPDPVIHCDFAARNLLLDSHLRAYLSDFGMARVMFLNKKEGRRTKNIYITSSNAPSMLIPFPWSAPETLKSLRFSTKSDVYMFGSTLYEILFRERPWRSLDALNVRSRVLSGKRPWMPHSATVSKVKNDSSEPFSTFEQATCGFSGTIRSLIQSCWAHDENKRPSISVVVDTLRKVSEDINSEGNVNSLPNDGQARLSGVGRNEEYIELKALDFSGERGEIRDDHWDSAAQMGGKHIKKEHENDDENGACGSDEDDCELEYSLLPRISS
mmetsp:Transcript_28281/g.68841  ORF Transcript_28281/g.68841 Transcript_28281/m.68841 type:complete len:755 (+) Transcript_28281:2-2266(+)